MNVTTKPAAGRARRHFRSVACRQRDAQARPDHRRGRQGDGRCATMTDLFKAHINPGQFHFMKLLGFHKVKVERAEGMYYIDQNGRKILDFFGGFGSLAFGHNHPRILAARQKFQDEKRHEIAIAFMSQYAAALAHNLAALLAGRSRHGVPRLVRLGGHGSGDQGRRARRRAEAAEDRLCRELLPRQDQGRAVDHRRAALPRRVQAGRQHGRGAVRRHRRDRAAPSAPIPRSASSCWKRCRAAAASSRRPPSSGRSCARSATSTACSGSPTRCSAASAAPAASTPSSITASCPT